MDERIPLSPRVADQVSTGTIAILESPHVTEGPGRIANAPVPSVYVSHIYTHICMDAVFAKWK